MSACVLACLLACANWKLVLESFFACFLSITSIFLRLSSYTAAADLLSSPATLQQQQQQKNKKNKNKKKLSKRRKKAFGNKKGIEKFGKIAICHAFQSLQQQQICVYDFFLYAAAAAVTDMLLLLKL